MDLQRLRTLREFAARGTVGAAAHALGYSPSAVSQQLAALERETGATLVRRSGRKLVLTPAGRTLADRAESILDLVERTQAELQQAQDAASGTVRLAVFQSAALALLPTALPILAVEAPRVRVEATQSEPSQALQDTWTRDFDLVVAEEYPHHSAPHYPGLIRETLVEDEIALALPPGEGSSTLRAQADRPWVMEPAGTASRHFAEQRCRIAGLEPDVRYETADLQAHLALITAGLARAFVPGLMWPAAHDAITRSPLEDHPRRTVFAAFRGTSAKDPALAVVLDALRRAADAVGIR